ncbi:MAG: LPS export ABC transporter periplasmic protein LptC [Chlamydiae bacterium]|nr:LPS export ABC transporter periplasmic protein LptC [Chlamydiota bacterium]MBI3267061.1 LPS export ABC transporter periplasmic protein LptC [Chlamydiota bacterium]
MFKRAFSVQRTADGKTFCLLILYAVRCMLCASFFLPILVNGVETGSTGDQITQGFRFVSPGFENEKRWKVEGDEAQFLSDDKIEIRPVRAVVYGRNEPDYFIESSVGYVDKNTRDVWTEAPVEITRGDFKLTGVGMYWETLKRTAVIHKNVKMVVDSSEMKAFKEM